MSLFCCEWLDESLMRVRRLTSAQPPPAVGEVACRNDVRAFVNGQLTSATTVGHRPEQPEQGRCKRGARTWLPALLFRRSVESALTLRPCSAMGSRFAEQGCSANQEAGHPLDFGHRIRRGAGP